jgi:hypothetical protein
MGYTATAVFAPHEAGAIRPTRTHMITSGDQFNFRWRIRCRMERVNSVNTPHINQTSS